MISSRGRSIQRCLAILTTVLLVSILVGGVGNVRGGIGPADVLSAARPAEITIPLGGAPFGMTFDPVNNRVYVDTPNCCSSNVSVINPLTNQVVTLIQLPTYSVGPIATDGGSGVVYVGDTGSTIYMINPSTNRIVGTVPLLSGCPFGCAPDVQVYDPANGDIYVTSVITNNVSVIHGSSFVTSIPAGAGPNGAAYDSANGDVYVSNEGSCSNCINITVISGTTNRVVGQVTGAGGGPGVAFDSANGAVYTCTNGFQPFSNFVGVANGTTNTLVATIPVDISCGRAAYDPANNYVYITDRSRTEGQYLSNVTLIDPNTNKVVLTQPVGVGPIPIVYDPANQNVYVGNAVSDTISVLPQIYRLTVRENGLPSGTNWSVTMNGTTFFSTSRTITFPETNGTFNYSVPKITLPVSSGGETTNYTASPSRGTVSVVGGPQMLNVTFSNRTGGGSSPGLFGLPGMTGYYALGGSIVLILAVAIFVLTRKKSRAGKPPVQSATPGSDRGDQ